MKSHNVILVFPDDYSDEYTLQEIFILSLISQHDTDVSVLHYNTETMSKKLHCSKDTVRRIMNNLESRGIIKITHNVGSENTVSIIRDDKKEDMPPPPPSPNPSKKVKNNHEIEFNIFWKNFIPVKCNGRFVDKGSKKEAYSKFIKILESGESFKNLIDGLGSYLAHCKKNNQLTCGVPVFLNQERWKNEYDATDMANPVLTKEQQIFEHNMAYMAALERGEL